MRNMLSTYEGGRHVVNQNHISVFQYIIKCYLIKRSTAQMQKANPKQRMASSEHP